MGTPQWIMIGLMLMDLGFSLAKHGEDRGEYSFWATLISTIITLLILNWGGFFK